MDCNLGFSSRPFAPCLLTPSASSPADRQAAARAAARDRAELADLGLAHAANEARDCHRSLPSPSSRRALAMANREPVSARAPAALLRPPARAPRAASRQPRFPRLPRRGAVGSRGSGHRSMRRPTRGRPSQVPPHLRRSLNPLPTCVRAARVRPLRHASHLPIPLRVGLAAWQPCPCPRHTASRRRGGTSTAVAPHP